MCKLACSIGCNCLYIGDAVATEKAKLLRCTLVRDVFIGKEFIWESQQDL